MLYQLSYGPMASTVSANALCYTHSTVLFPLHSGQGRNRTTDTTIFSRVLYQLSYLAYHLARYLAHYLQPLPATATWPEKKSARPFGGGRLGEGCALPAF